MHNKFLRFFMIGICLIFTTKSFTQSSQDFDQIDKFLDDATMYSERYITPATDCAVYQSSAGWLSSAKKRKLYDIVLGVHGNLFFVPKSDRNFQINNSDFSFFTIENATSAIVPTALGNDSQYYLVGQIDNNEVRMETPKGVNQETISYPYLQASISLWKGFELIAKYSTKTKLKRSEYQVYGFGLKHNFSQYIKLFEKSKINMAALFAFSKENVGFDFLNPQTPLGTLGISRINGLVDTYQFQLSLSKDWKKFELMFSLITNNSDFKYKFSGEKGTIDEVISFNGRTVQEEFNRRLENIYKKKYIGLAEISGRYQFSKIYIQTTLAFGKFVNSNLSIQYEF